MRGVRRGWDAKSPQRPPQKHLAHTGTASLQRRQGEAGRRGRRIDQQVEVAALLVLPTRRSAEHARPRDAVTGDDLPQRARASAPLVHGRGIPPGPAGQTRILYRVVDGYDGDTLSEKRTRSSKRPLSRGELIVFLTAWPLQEVLEMNQLDRDGARNFRQSSSEVYPQFAAAMRAGIDGWHAEGGAGRRGLRMGGVIAEPA